MKRHYYTTSTLKSSRRELVRLAGMHDRQWVAEYFRRRAWRFVDDCAAIGVRIPRSLRHLVRSRAYTVCEPQDKKDVPLHYSPERYVEIVWWERCGLEQQCGAPCILARGHVVECEAVCDEPGEHGSCPA